MMKQSKSVFLATFLTTVTSISILSSPPAFSDSSLPCPTLTGTYQCWERIPYLSEPSHTLTFTQVTSENTEHYSLRVLNPNDSNFIPGDFHWIAAAKKYYFDTIDIGLLNLQANRFYKAECQINSQRSLNLNEDWEFKGLPDDQQLTLNLKTIFQLNEKGDLVVSRVISTSEKALEPFKSKTVCKKID